MNQPIPDGVLIDPSRRLHGATVPLRRPVKHGAAMLERVVLEPLSAAHVRKAPDEWGETGPVLEFAGELSGLPPSVLDQVAGADLGELVRATFHVAWPMLDLPVQWEAVWARRREAALAGAPGHRLRDGKPEVLAEDGLAWLPVPPGLPDVAGGHELELEAPIALERDQVSRMRFEELTGRVARRCPIDAFPVKKLPWLVEELTGTPRAVVDQLRGRDLHRALALAQLFFLAIRGTTATSG